MKAIHVIGLGALVAGVAGEATAGGFSLRERSAHAQGASFAGSTAAAADVTYALFNPAALGRVETAEIGGGLSAIIPDIDAKAAFNGETDRPGEVGFAPSGAFGYRVNEWLVVGLGVHSPFGLATEYDEDFIGAEDGIRSELISIAATPMIAVEVTPGLTLGGSVSIIYNDPQLTRRVGFDAVTGAPQEAKLDAKEVEFSGALGVLWDVTADTTLGVSFDSGYKIKTGGTLRAFNDAGDPIRRKGDASISLPLSITAGFRHQATERFAIMGEFEWAEWSRFDEIRVDVPSLAPDNDIGEVTNYRNSIFVALGGEYDWDDALTLRAGLAYDQTPTQRNGRSIRIPDADRIWTSAGLSYRPTAAMELSLGYSAVIFLDPDVTLLNGPAAGTSVDYDGVTHIVSAGVTYRF